MGTYDIDDTYLPGPWDAPPPPDPRFRRRVRQGETWWDSHTAEPLGRSWLDRLLDEQQRIEPPPPPQPTKPTRPVSHRAREVLHHLPRQSRTPGGRHRPGQRSPERKIAPAPFPVDPTMVLGAFSRRWRGRYGLPGPWRVRGLAVIAIAMSAPPGTTLEAMSRMLPGEVLKLYMPLTAWRWVVRWLRTRRMILGPQSDHEPWVSFVGSPGMPRQISGAATRTLARAGLPGWRVNELLRASWSEYPMPEPFGRVANRLLLTPESPLRGLALALDR